MVLARVGPHLLASSLAAGRGGEGCMNEWRWSKQFCRKAQRRQRNRVYLRAAAAAAAKSLQSCPTLCDPIDVWQPTRFPRPWDSPGKNTGVGSHFLLQCMKVKLKVNSLSPVRLFLSPWTVIYQAPPSMGFSRQEYWSGLPFPSPDFMS